MARQSTRPAIEPAVLTTPPALAAVEIRDCHGELIDRRSNPGVLIAIPSDELPPPAQRIILIKPGLNGYFPTPWHLPDKSTASAATYAWNARHGFTAVEALDIAIESIRSATRTPALH